MTQHSHPGAMIPSKLSLKLYASAPAVLDTHKALEVLHGWVKRQTLGELLVDVVDYGHVKEGPAVLLVGHESDYALDLGEGRLGLSYQRKRVPVEPAVDHLHDGLKRLVRAATLLHGKVPGLELHASEVLLRVLDRLALPNDAQSFDAARPAIHAVLARALGDGVTLTREANDPREPLTVRAKASGARSLADAASALG